MSDGQITQLLRLVGHGDQSAQDTLWDIIHAELRRIAQHHMANEAPGRTLQPTALVHEAYFRLIGNGDVEWSSRHHFFSSAAQAMRRILIDDARKRKRLKRGGLVEHIPLEDVHAAIEYDASEVLGINDALQKLMDVDPRQGEVVMLRYFAGLSVAETAAALDMSPRTVEMDWHFAKAWLHRELSQENSSEEE